MKLTDSQREAIENLDQDLCVSAGAGSGKTEVLTQRFCYIVEQGKAQPDQILTVTFTEKAAREMKQRIAREFAKRGLEEQRRQVELAYIGTIHSFCARILRENAFEAGVDPKFNVLDGPTEETLAREVFDDLCEQLAVDPNSGMMDLLEAFGTRDVGLLSEAALGTFAHLRSLGWGAERLPEVAAPDPAPVVAALRAAVEGLLAYDSTPKVVLTRNLDALDELWPQLEPQLDSSQPGWETVSLLEDLLKRIKSGVQADAKDLVAAVREALDAVRAAWLDVMAAPHLNTLRRVLIQFEQAYAEAKDRDGYLDFDDLLIKTRDLFLSTPNKLSPTAELYRERFCFILMDEFQDTNRLQAQIVNTLRRPNNFFVVGDIKQSIFGFIYSDVEVFRDHRRAISGTGGKVIPLAENFRSRDGVIGFVNTLFERLWAEDPDFEFEPLKRAAEFDRREGPEVELLLVPQDDGVRLPDARQTEAKLIARRIRQLVGADGSDPLIVTRHDGWRGQPLQYGDIMMLFRATTDVQLYERALHDADIPYYVVSGRGFFTTQEVADLHALLRVVEQPLDDLRMAVVLRSPMVGVSADALYWLSRDWGESPSADPATWPADISWEPGKLARNLQMLDRIPAFSDADRRKLADLRDLWHRLSDLRPYARITQLLDETFKATDYPTRVLAQSTGKRKYANVRKLYEIAQSYQEQGSFGLSEFLRYLETLRELAQRETEAPTEGETANVVRLMSIHSAKGLQAPVVFVADLGRQSTSDIGQFIFSPAGGLAFKLRNPLSNKPVAGERYKEIADQLRTKDEAERKRLFYVAATRAEELLVLSGAVKYGAAQKPTFYETGTWSGWLTKALGITAPPPNGEQTMDLGGQPVTLHSDLPVGSEPMPESWRKSFLKHFREAVKAGQPIAPTQQDLISEADSAWAQEIVGRSRFEVPTVPAPVRISVTDLLTFQQCPHLYYLRREVGAVEELFAQNGSPSTGGKALGTLVHDLLSQYDFAAAPMGGDAVTTLAEDERIGLTVAQLVDTFRAMPIFDEIQTASERYTELPFELKLPLGVLTGKLDLLYRGPQGWVVVDYKTGDPSDELEREYEFQVAVYALAVSQLTGEMPARIVLLLLSKNEEQSEQVTQPQLDDLRGQLDSLFAQVQSDDRALRRGAECEHCVFRGTLCR